MIQFTTFILYVCTCYSTGQVYVDYAYPYQSGEFDVASKLYTPLGPGINSPPMHCKAFYPTEEGNYAVMYFLTGFGSLMPPDLYENFTSAIASHGYVVYSNWALVGDDGAEIGPEVHLQQIEWLETNTVDDLDGAIPFFDHMSVGCHSAGCGATLNLLKNDSSVALASVNIEPVSFAILRGDIDFAIPVLNYGTEYANMSCAYPGVDFLAWQEKSQCPKIMMQTDETGHCDVLDDEYWQQCLVNQTCTTPYKDDEQRQDYMTLVQGLASAFMTAYAQGNMDQLKYVTDPELIPWTLLMHEVVPECNDLT